MKTITILDDYQNVALQMADWDRLKDRARIRVLNRHIADRGELVEALAGSNAIVCNRERTPVTRELIALLPDLEFITTSGMRNASIDVQAATDRNIPVSGTQTLGYPTAELTVGMILGYFRNLPAEVASLKSGGWQTTIGTGVRGKTLGIVGYGRIGKDVARVGLALGMRVIGFSRSLTPEKAAGDGIECGSLEQLLRESDVVSVHLGVNAATRGIIGREQLAMMKSTALLVNTARAVLVDQKALVDALNDGTIGGAALDVYDMEPLPQDHPLMRTPNTMLVPHLGYVMEENYRLSFGQIVENLDGWLNGSPPRVIEP